MKHIILRRFIFIPLIYCLHLILSSHYAHSESIIKSLPWSAGGSFKDLEFIENNQVESGTSHSLYASQSIAFFHPYHNTFDAGFYSKLSLKNSDNEQRYWENVQELTYGLEVYKTFSTKNISWGKIKFSIGKKDSDHNDNIGKPFDSNLDEIKLEVNLTGDFLK